MGPGSITCRPAHCIPLGYHPPAVRPAGAYSRTGASLPHALPKFAGSQGYKGSFWVKIKVAVFATLDQRLNSPLTLHHQGRARQNQEAGRAVPRPQ